MTDEPIKCLTEYVLANELRLPNDFTRTILEKLIVLKNRHCEKCPVKFIPNTCSCGAYYCKDHKIHWLNAYCEGNCDRKVCESCSMRCQMCRTTRGLCAECMSSPDSKARCAQCRIPCCSHCKRFCTMCKKNICTNCSPPLIPQEEFGNSNYCRKCNAEVQESNEKAELAYIEREKKSKLDAAEEYLNNEKKKAKKK